jgi:hypothetical protein
MTSRFRENQASTGSSRVLSDGPALRGFQAEDGLGGLPGRQGRLPFRLQHQPGFGIGDAGADRCRRQRNQSVIVADQEIVGRDDRTPIVTGRLISPRSAEDGPRSRLRRARLMVTPVGLCPWPYGRITPSGEASPAR